MRMRLLGLISATALTACGGGSDAPPAPAPAPALPTVPVAPPAVTPVTPPAPSEPPPVPVTPTPTPTPPPPVTQVPVPELPTTPPVAVTPVPTPTVPTPPVLVPTPPTPTPPPVTPPASGGPYTLPARTVGDFVTYTDVTMGWKVSVTQAITKVNADGGWENADSVSQEKGAQTIEKFDAKGGMLSSNSYAGCTATYAPAAMQAPASASVGDSFDFASTMSIPCSKEETARALTSKGTVVGIESKTVPAGTFSTLKMVSNETNLDLRTANVYVNYWVERTCWRDIITGLMVACNTRTTSKGSGDVSFSSATELVSYGQASTNREFLDPIRYAGPWSGNFGAWYGICDLNIGFSGVITGSCKAAARTTAVTGSVDKAGVVKLNMSVAGGTTETQSGQAALFDMSGQLAGAAAPGAWTLKHK
ncbi:hypothetical protein F2P45_21325 [Massilia sp. CCM 8733]|uniref:Uncharacterized protein n=1 Tax=Massilia mucilaginosa TaxID=2609282 RepID=A0ABX0NYU4_9BURK|nr:hypothetical protein [Massilia mucilaginosa]NHZ91527.1 hypothetical protein [Massilia mucilaginosa]